MLRHVAVFTWKPETTSDQTEVLSDALAALPGQIPEIRSYLFGPDAGLTSGNDVFAVVADFDDADAYRRYAEHPAHQELLAKRVRPILATRHAVQFVPPGPSATEPESAPSV